MSVLERSVDTMANQINHEVVLCNSMIAGKTAEEIRRQFRGSGTKNTIAAMTAIVAKYSAIDHPNAVLVVNMAQAVMANPQEATVEKNWLDMIPAQGQAQVKASKKEAKAEPPVFGIPVTPVAQVIAPVQVAAPVAQAKVTIENFQTKPQAAPQQTKTLWSKANKGEKVEPVVVVEPWFIDGVGMYRVTFAPADETSNIENYALESLAQGHWSVVMSTRWYRTNFARTNLLLQAVSSFKDLAGITKEQKVEQCKAQSKSQEDFEKMMSKKLTSLVFTVKIRGEEVDFLYCWDKKNPSITTMAGKNYISKSQARFYGNAMKQYLALSPVCAKTVADCASFDDINAKLDKLMEVLAPAKK